MTGTAPITGIWPAGLTGVAAVRIARPTGRLEEIGRFYAEGLGLPVIGSFADHAGFSGIIIGLPGPAYHLEFTQTTDAGIDEGRAPTDDNNLVLYLRDAASVAAVVNKLAAMGFAVVSSSNPYWDDHCAVAVADPDGWRLILMPESPDL